jgi:hypothetical protein
LIGRNGGNRRRRRLRRVTDQQTGIARPGSGERRSHGSRPLRHVDHLDLHDAGIVKFADGKCRTVAYVARSTLIGAVRRLGEKHGDFRRAAPECFLDHGWRRLQRLVVENLVGNRRGLASGQDGDGQQTQQRYAYRTQARRQSEGLMSNVGEI